MASTNGHLCRDFAPEWKSRGQRYFSLNFALRQRFGGRVQKVSIDAGFSCPNVDGTVTVGGCNFCDNRSFSPSRRLPRTTIQDQIDEGIRRLQRRYKVDRFIAYFQPATNTHAPVEKLRTVYSQALNDDRIVGVAIGTRPDCMGADVIELLNEFGERTYLSVELGLQTVHDRSLAWMNRGHGFQAVVDAVARCEGRTFDLGAHVMLGLPGESHQDMMKTAEAVSKYRMDSVKIHNLYVVDGTPLADEYRRGSIELLDRETYVSTIVDFIERLPTTCCVDRLSGEAPPDYFVAPSWCQQKAPLIRLITEEFERRDSYQGDRCRC